MTVFLLILACAQQSSNPTAKTVVPAVENDDTAAPENTLPEDRNQWIRRMSFDLRGIPPSENDLLFLESNPDAWPDLGDHYMSGPEFTERMVHLYAEN